MPEYKFTTSEEEEAALTTVVVGTGLDNVAYMDARFHEILTAYIQYADAKGIEALSEKMKAAPENIKQQVRDALASVVIAEAATP